VSAHQTDPMIGRLVDGRYQVRSRIARGGMATVYLATDLRLERRVAIKIMHGHLADDASFKERFVQEARSAASLAHPNVVNVFDQGQDDESAYLVMEYLPGITLRELLQDHRVLTTEQAMDILEAVLAGLAAAHAAGIVHRDLKPENVLLADDGRIKIGDFGLARAATANTATGAALLGTIAYLSPELVTRGVADTRSDIYALGIMLFEMLTGEQPYKGEQPMQIAYQHANDTVPAPSLREPTVPLELDELVLWATARDPEHRPRDARALLEQVVDVQRVLRDPSGPPLARTMVLPPAAAPRTSGATGETTVLPGARHRTGPVPPAPTDALAASAARRRRRGRAALVLVLLLMLLAGGAAWWFGAGPGGQALVPDVAGSDPAAAASTLTEAGFVVADERHEDFSVTVPAGQVAGTDPAAEVSVRRGAEVALVVSQGPEPLDLPSVVGQQEAEAAASLDRFSLTDPVTQFRDEPDGTVVGIAGVGADGESVDLADADEYGEQQPVTLTVSLGPVPDVAGQGVDEAVAALQAVDLTGVEQEREFSEDVPAGIVLRATPQGEGPVVPGGTVDLVVSKGPAPVVLPDVRGQSIASATKTLDDVGILVSYDECTNVLCEVLDGWRAVVLVDDTVPAAGTSIERGSTVRLTYRQ